MAATTTGRGRGRPRRADRPPAGSRGELLDAAAKVFARRGFRAATVDEIVAEAGLSKGTFYWVFEGKDDLFLSLLEERLDAPARRVVDTLRDAPADEPTAASVGAGLAALFASERDLVLLLHEYWAAAVRDERLATRYRARQAALRETLSSALAARHERTGVPMTMDAERLATAFLALADGLALHALAEPGRVDAELFGDVAALVYDGMVQRSGRWRR